MPHQMTVIILKTLVLAVFHQVYTVTVVYNSNYCQCITISTECFDGEIKLIGGQTEREGTIQICLRGAWGTVCDIGWTSANAMVACRQLGFHTKGTVGCCYWVSQSVITHTTDARAYHRSYFGQGSGPIWPENAHFRCTGHESELLQCNQYRYWYCTNHNRDAGVRCLGNPCDEVVKCEYLCHS